MPVPKKRVSRTRRDKRRTHKRVSVIEPTTCPQCSEPKIPHRICPHCGYYRDRVMVETKD